MLSCWSVLLIGVVLGNTRIGGHETVVWSAVWYLGWCDVTVLGDGGIFDSKPGEVSHDEEGRVGTVIW